MKNNCSKSSGYTPTSNIATLLTQVTFSPPIFIADLSVYATYTQESHAVKNGLPVHANVLVAESFLTFPTQRDTLRGKLVCNFHDPMSGIIVMPQSSVQQDSYRLSANLIAKQINPQSSETPAQRININRPGVVAFDITERHGAKWGAVPGDPCE